jgi:hypothetical protein
LASKWISHVKQYAKDNNISYKDALKKASSTYKKFNFFFKLKHFSKKKILKLVTLMVRPVMWQFKHGGRGTLPWGVKPRWSSDRTALWGPLSAVPYAGSGRHDVHATHTLTRSSTPCP